MKPQKKIRTRETQEVRKSALIQATIKVIAEYGISNVTSQKVALEAGITAAMVNFHFKGKTPLLHATLKFVADEFIEYINSVGSDFSEPRAQLLSLINATMAENIFNEEKNAVWYAFYSEARSREDYTVICSQHDEAYYQAYHKPIQTLCNSSPHPMNAHALTLGLIGIMEHAAQTMLIEPNYNRNDGIQDCVNFLDSVFPKN